VKAEAVIEMIGRGIREGRPAHAYLLVGPPRGEPARIADHFARTLLCVGADKPCGRCRSCEMVARGTHPDYMRVEPEKKSRIISVGQVRDVLRQLGMTSFVGGGKVCTLVAADRMNKEGANALLKTLEEPTASTLFFLLTDRPQRLLPTILSRCQRVTVQEPGASGGEFGGKLAVALGRLAPSGEPADAGGVINGFAAAAGVLRVLKELKQSVKDLYDGDAEEDDEVEVDPGKDVVNARIEALYREERAGLLGFMGDWFRDILALSVCGPDAPVVLEDFREATAAAARGMGAAGALEGVRAVEELSARLDTTFPEAVAVEDAVLKLAEAARRSGARA